MASGLVFVTVGTTEFDTFIQHLCDIECLKELKKLGYTKLKIQIGKGNFTPSTGNIEGIDVSYYRYKDSITSDITEADLVISHAGAGSCLEVLDANKPLLVVINENLMNNHQTELADELYRLGHLYSCTPSSLKSTLQTVDFSKLKSLANVEESNLMSYLEQFMGLKSN